MKEFWKSVNLWHSSSRVQ